MIQMDMAVVLIDVDLSGYIKTLDANMGRLIRGAARTFLVTLLHHIEGAPHVNNDTFPVQTGRAKGSIRPLARTLLKAGVPLGASFNITPAAGKPDRSAQGEALGRATLQDDKNRPSSDYVYYFQWITNVRYFKINEEQHVPGIKSSTPWRAVEAAEAAARAYIDDNIAKAIPKTQRLIRPITASGRS